MNEAAGDALHDPARSRLDGFLRGIQNRALTAARLSVPDEDALDCVQDAMFQFVRRYTQRPESEWRPLFFKILYNRLKDFHRRRAVRQAVVWITGEAVDAPSQEPEPTRWMAAQAAGAELLAEIERLPLRQQQAFLLRVWEGLDTNATAVAMDVDAGTVKTHLSRALKRLRQVSGKHYEYH